MNRSLTNQEPFNGSGAMRSFNRSGDEKAGAFPIEVIFTARVVNGSVWSTTIVIPPFAERTRRKDIQ